MKAFLNRINRGLLKEKDRDKDPVHKEKIPQLPPLTGWPPRAAATPTSVYKPLPEISTRPLPPVDEPTSSSTESSSVNPTPTGSIVPLPAAEVNHDAAPPLEMTVSSAPSRVDNDSAGRNSRKTNSSSGGSAAHTDVQKKVAFISPPPTPSPEQNRALSPSETPTPANPIPLKTTVSRFQAAHVKDTRGSTSTATSSKIDVASTTKSTKPASTRAATSPYLRSYGDGASIHQSLRSGTPYSQMTNASTRILAAQSWSEVAEEDLVSNIGQRERTRQEVLWEIVASEERYVTELLKMKETFIEPLLHPYSSSSPASPTAMGFNDEFTVDSPRESIEHLPIASRFLSPTPFRSESPTAPTPPLKDEPLTPNIDGESLNSEEEEEAEDRMGKGLPASRKGVHMSIGSKHNHPRSPYGATVTRTGSRFGTSVPFPSRSHQSLPPPPRTNPLTGSTQSLGRQSVHEKDPNNLLNSPRPSTTTPSTSVFRRFKKSNPTPTPTPTAAIPGAISPQQLPEDLRKCLEVIEGGILDGHIKLSEGLRKRYEEQYPLVRSLADVFVSNSHILHGYATFVLHLERALEQVDTALSTANASKKPKKQDPEQLKVCQYLEKLEILASEKGETGLAISLSKPFQRLLKYPLLFQNLLFHTDPSTFEYESTLQMVAEVETIVRSIEDEKIQKEERDKTRDVFARIEGLDKVKQLMVPKPSRVLIEERPVIGLNPIAEPGAKPNPPTSSQNPRAVKGKTSFKRLSDVLQAGSSGVGGKRDQWLVVFNDVVLRCQRTGTTSLPLVAATNSRTNSLPELQGKAKYATTGRRNSQGKPRNMYKFLKIETWAIGDVVQPREGVVSMEDVVRSRQQVHSGMQQQPRIVPMPDDDEGGGDSDDSDRKSKMSFSYWGADKVTLQKPAVKPRQLAGTGARRGVPATSYARESSANAKFGTRLMSGPSGEHPNNVRPASRRTQATPTSRRPAQSDDGHTVKATVTRDRPAWNTSTREAVTPVPKKERTRNISQTSAAATRTPTSAPTPTLATAKLPSPAPSEDSGVGLYRTLIAQNPSLGRIPT